MYSSIAEEGTSSRTHLNAKSKIKKEKAIASKKPTIANAKDI